MRILLLLVCVICVLSSVFNTREELSAFERVISFLFPGLISKRMTFVKFVNGPMLSSIHRTPEIKKISKAYKVPKMMSNAFKAVKGFFKGLRN